MCGGAASVCPQSPSLGSQPPAGSLFLPRSLAPRPRLLGERGPQGKGCGCRGESPVGVRHPPKGHLQALPDSGLWGCGGDQDLLGGCPPHSTAAHPLPFATLEEGGKRAYPEPRPSSPGEALPARPGWGPAGGNQMLRPHSWEQSAAARSAGLPSPFVSPLPGFLRAPPPHPPHSNLPGRTKAAPVPDAPTSGSPQTRAPLPSQLASSFKALPELSKWPLSICSDGRGSGTPAAAPRSGTRRAEHRPPRPAARDPRALPAEPRSPARAYLARPLRRPLRVRRQNRPFARCEPPSGPPTAGVRLPAPDPLGPNARAAAQVAAPSGPPPASRGGPGEGEAPAERSSGLFDT